MTASSGSTKINHPSRRDWLLDRTEELCRVDTTTGFEDRGLPPLREQLNELDAKVTLQEVAPKRHNVLATWGEPQLLFSTHLDTVPPYLPPRRSSDLLSGRGTCDAKGQVVVQLATIRELLSRGYTSLGWLGVVGEETDSIGAATADSLAPQLTKCIGLINGEPTENKLATGQRGSLQLQLSTKGVAAHSGMPELGHSAIWPMLDWIKQLRELMSTKQWDEERVNVTTGVLGERSASAMDSCKSGCHSSCRCATARDALARAASRPSLSFTALRAAVIELSIAPLTRERARWPPRKAAPAAAPAPAVVSGRAGGRNWLRPSSCCA